MKNAEFKKYIIPCIIILFFIIVIFFINKNRYELHNDEKYNENLTKTQLITETGVVLQGEADNISVREIKAYTKGRRYAVFTEIELEPYSHNMKKLTSVIDDNDKVIAEYTWFNECISSKKEENKLTQYVVDNNGNIAKIIITTYDVSYSNTIYELEYMYDVIYIPSGEVRLVKGFICNNKKYYFVRNDKNYISEITDEGGNVLLKYSYEGNVLKHAEILDLQDNIVTLNPIVGEDFIYDDVTDLYFVHSSAICDFVNGGNFFEAEDDKNDTKSEHNSASHKMDYNLYTEKERQIISSSDKVKAKFIEEVSEDCNIYG